VPSNCDLHEDMLRFLLNARVNTHGFTAVESLVIHSHKVEPTLIPYVMFPFVTTTSETTVQFFFTIIGEL
jgi:hypothetical protein